MTTTSLFSKFCEYVDKTIFSEENMGGVVAFVVDKNYIERFCENNGTTERELMLAVKGSLWSSYLSPSLLQIKGILAIQLYAASKRANSNGITSVNYRDRLVQVLDWNIDSLQDWMVNNQDRYWRRLYDWCDEQGFIIAKSYPKYGAGRYVQYPTQQAERVFTEEELLYIACYFNDSRLSPGEDISEKSFWKVIDKYRLYRYASSSHARTILYSDEYCKDGYTQIYNYYLRWDGTYKSLSDYKKRTTSARLDDLYIDGDFSNIEIRDEKFNITNRIGVNELTINKLRGLYNFKRDGFILFKRNDIYDNYWEETRFLIGQEEGIAIRFVGSGRNYVSGQPFFRSSNIEIYKVNVDNAKPELYTEEKYYFLEGGLKIARMQYILGAAPLLRVNKSTKFWIDGVVNEAKGDSTLFKLPLEVGHHYIKFPSQPKLELTIIDPIAKEHIWSDKYFKWRINRKDESWESISTDEGVVGLNFSCMHGKTVESINPLSSWASYHVFGKEYPSNNIVIKLLNQTK
jgi:hypothetical protein